MAKGRKYKYVIVVDESNVPMVWSEHDKQLVYCTDERWRDKHMPVTYYAESSAKRFIEKTIKNRKRWRMDVGTYLTMPFKRK